MLLLYINGQLADLDAGQVIAQTKQVNDLNSLENRQTSYTNKFKLPKTANNILIMDFLTLAGNKSNIPYQKNECSLYNDSGECFVYKGWAVVTDGGENYEVVVYDGIIDLYKMIENTSLAALDLSGLNHTKNFESIINSWDATYGKPYRYILADYNGNTGRPNTIIGGPSIFIDHLIPSVNVAWLWAQIFATYSVTYSGSIFDTQEFKNLWMTYPNGIDAEDAVIPVFSANNLDHYNAPQGGTTDMYWKTMLFKYINPSLFNTTYLQPDSDGFRLKALEPGYYRVKISGKLKSVDRVVLLLAKNITSATNQALENIPVNAVFSINLNPDTDFDTSTIVYLNANESISVLLRQDPFRGYVRRNGNDGWGITIDMTNIGSHEISFTEAFSEFPIKDFLSEVVHRFGLTFFKDKTSNHYTCLTVQEQLQTPGEVDLSTKFVKKISENYIHGNYAQRNWFRYNYDNKESAHNDAFIDIQNINLPDNKDIIKSKIYSPEKEKKRYLRRQSNVYKLWEKEVVENPEEGESAVTYRPLDKRFYFLRAEPLNKNIILFKPGIPSATASSIWVESFWKLSFTDILKDYYQSIRQILDKTKVVTVELLLNDSDIANFDFKKLYYLEQLSSSFIMNKINNYVPGKPVKCEMIRIQNTLEDIVSAPPLKITKVVVSGYYITVYFNLNIATGTVNLQISNDGQATWQNWYAAATQNPRYHSVPGVGNYDIRLQAGTGTTPSIPIKIPDEQTIIIS
ncbi:hypothetical protein D3C87_1003510 [compost metagenome]